LVRCKRALEAGHRDTRHTFANGLLQSLTGGLRMPLRVAQAGSQGSSSGSAMIDCAVVGEKFLTRGGTRLGGCQGFL
jgi:hypothetical protein